MSFAVYRTALFLLFLGECSIWVSAGSRTYVSLDLPKKLNAIEESYSWSMPPFRDFPDRQKMAIDASVRHGTSPMRSWVRVPRGGATAKDILFHSAVGLWAFSGTLAAGRQQMDVVGCFVIAFFSAMGGATLRDVLLDRPVFWVVDGHYIVTVAAVSSITFAVYPYIDRALRHSGSEWEKARVEGTASTATILLQKRENWVLRTILEVPDALGMSLYSVYGAYVAMHDCPVPTGPLPAIWLGLVGSCFGSFAVDLLCHVSPKLLCAKRNTLYMTPALLASSLFALWDRWAPASSQVLGAIVSISIAFALRIYAFIFDVKLPHWLDLSRDGNDRRARFSQKVAPNAPVFGVDGEPLMVGTTKPSTGTAPPDNKARK